METRVIRGEICMQSKKKRTEVWYKTQFRLNIEYGSQSVKIRQQSSACKKVKIRKQTREEWIIFHILRKGTCLKCPMKIKIALYEPAVVITRHHLRHLKYAREDRPVAEAARNSDMVGSYSLSGHTPSQNRILLCTLLHRYHVISSIFSFIGCSSSYLSIPCASLAMV